VAVRSLENLDMPSLECGFEVIFIMAYDPHIYNLFPEQPL